MKKNEPLHMRIHPSVVSQLGESLITDAIQALIEVVKNSYDADATYANVIIDTQGVICVDGASSSPEKGQIIIEDDGQGMNYSDIANGWLTISNRQKRDLKAAKKTTKGGRTPLGDKGLGRLGVQRLGNIVEIFTKTNNDKAWHLKISWPEFDGKESLDDIDIVATEINFPRKHGTIILISDLKEIDFWQGQKSIKSLEQELSQIISPYRQIRDFSVFVEADGKQLELQEINDRVREIAPIRYKIEFDGHKFTVAGRAKLDFFCPQSQKEADEFALIVESDKGKEFFQYLISQQKHAKTISLRRSKSSQWFVEFSCGKILEDIDKVERIQDKKNIIANPGPFIGEVDSYDLGAMMFQSQSVFDRIKEYRSYVKGLSGIRVYRDGFAIRVDQDWLKLGGQWTSAPSYYGLKPDTTLGFISLSARDNIDLEETTDREGFKDTPYYRNFYALLEEFKSFTSFAHEFFGRSWSNYRKYRNEQAVNIDSRKTIEDITTGIKQGLGKAAEQAKKLSSIKSRLQESVTSSKKTILQIKSVKEITPDIHEKFETMFAEFEPILSEANDAINQLDHLIVLQSMGDVLNGRVESLRRQRDEMFEAIALGLAAEALSHEIENIVDQLAKRAKSAQTKLRNQETNNRSIISFIEYVYTSVMALRKQVSFLSSSLRHVREQKQDINIMTFLEELVDFYQERMKRNSIKIHLRHDSLFPCTVHMNRGKLTQIIDNLIINSEYWLKEDMAQGKIETGEINFVIDAPFIYVFDNGRGIDPSIEDALFEPFVSKKAKGQGRGLGLFIVKQLLDSEGCAIGIVPERNRRKRLFKFQLNLRGAINNE